MSGFHTLLSFNHARPKDPAQEESGLITSDFNHCTTSLAQEFEIVPRQTLNIEPWPQMPLLGWGQWLVYFKSISLSLNLSPNVVNHETKQLNETIFLICKLLWKTQYLVSLSESRLTTQIYYRVLTHLCYPTVIYAGKSPLYSFLFQNQSHLCNISQMKNIVFISCVLCEAIELCWYFV